MPSAGAWKNPNLLCEPSKRPKIQLRCSDACANDNESIMHTHEYIVKYSSDSIWLDSCDGRNVCETGEIDLGEMFVLRDAVGDASEWLCASECAPQRWWTRSDERNEGPNEVMLDACVSECRQSAVEWTLLEPSELNAVSACILCCAAAAAVCASHLFIFLVSVYLLRELNFHFGFSLFAQRDETTRAHTMLHSSVGFIPFRFNKFRHLYSKRGSCFGGMSASMNVSACVLPLYKRPTDDRPIDSKKKRDANAKLE